MNPRMTVLQTVALGHLAIPPLQGLRGAVYQRMPPASRVNLQILRHLCAENLPNSLFSANLAYVKWKIISAALLLIVGAIALAWFGVGSRGHATPLAAQQLEELHTTDIPALVEADELEPEDVELLARVLEEFYRKQDPRYADPATGMTLLHLACLFKKTELARCLLLDGADPNARSAEASSPLLRAVSTALTPHATTQEITALVDTLLAGGADFALSGRSSTDFLTEAALQCENEDVLLHLMQRGAKASADTAMPLALHGWVRALEAVLQQQPRTDGLMHALAVGSAAYSGRYVECLELLHSRGAAVGEQLNKLPGATPLYELARELGGSSESAPHYEQAVEVLVWLLQHGADPYLRSEWDEEFPGFCPYDHLSSAPGLLEKLSARGVALKAPELRFSSGLSLLAEVCRVAIAPPPARLLAEHYDAVAALLTAPTAEMLRAEMYPQALVAAVKLLTLVSPQRTTQSIEAMPLWLLSEPAATEGEDALAALTRALQDTPTLAPGADFLCRQAERLLADGRAEEASVMVELLARCPGAEEAIARYSTDPRLPLQAGAYAARLYAANLPDARNNGVVSWLAERNREPNTPFLREAVLLTSLERLWYGQMPTEEQTQLLDLMRRIGAHHAAAAYERIVHSLDKPEELDALMSRGDDWKYELEAATARFFLAHKDEFFTTVSE